MWHDRLWLIDHGAALYFHHGDGDPAAHARRPFERIAEHVLLPAADSILEADERLAPQVERGLLEELAHALPEAWLDGDDAGVYADYLGARLETPSAFAQEAEEARRRG